MYVGVYSVMLANAWTARLEWGYPRSVADPWEYTGDIPISGDRNGSQPVPATVIKKNTELLLWVDLFSGYVITRESSSRSVKAIAEGYEECLFQRFGASGAIRHNRKPGFMSDFFERLT